jgi:hypothetical protein
MDDTPALYHCAGPLCANEIGQPAGKFWLCQIRSFRKRGVPLLCRRCVIYSKFERVYHSLPTAFELELEHLGLNGDQQEWAESKDLRRWAVKHASACYVPERLLSIWRIPVTLDL